MKEGCGGASATYNGLKKNFSGGEWGESGYSGLCTNQNSSYSGRSYGMEKVALGHVVIDSML